jgi:hypothetical protein
MIAGIASVTARGMVAAVHGVVLDVDVSTGTLPAVGNALLVRRGDGPPLAVEMQAHLSPTSVRCVALSAPTGVRRGLEVRDTGAAVRVPVGNAVLGGVSLQTHPSIGLCSDRARAGWWRSAWVGFITNTCDARRDPIGRIIGRDTTSAKMLRAEFPVQRNNTL